MSAENKKPLVLRFGIRSLLILIAISAMSLFGYQQWMAYKTLENARQWVTDQEAKGYSRVHCPPAVSKKRMIPTLVAGALHLETQYEKTCCLKVMAELFPQECLGGLVQVALGCKDPEVQQIAVHLISLRRDVDALSRLNRLAKSQDPKTRAARLDCIGFTRVPSYEQSFSSWETRWGGSSGQIDCAPQIGTAGIFNGGMFEFPFFTSEGDIEPSSRFALRENFPEHYRHELEQVMLADDSSPEERAAAARAIVVWPPANYQLRYAEWGVWINSDGKFHMVDSIIDEIPEFVHRTGNELEAFVERLSIPMVVTKPVIHLTCNKPMAIDLDVVFNLGRPWFAYPRPDDFQVLTSLFSVGGGPEVSSLLVGPPNLIGEEIEVREGYPWSRPHHRQHYALRGLPSTAEIDGLGLHWQSAIVSPTKLPWMQLPKVAMDPKYKWWKDLRDVECSWVSSLNESERFIYYDGPTLAESPMHLEYLADNVQVSKQAIFEAAQRVELSAPSLGAETVGGKEVPIRHGFFIRVNESGMFGSHIQLEDGQELDLETIELSEATDVRENMLGCLKEAGLNDGEAAALLKCWTPAFFEEPGQRIVFLLHKSEYDLMCPMEIRPKPTELARVGLVLTELLD